MTVSDSTDPDVLDVFVSNGRLTIIPAERSKRLVVPDHLAPQFEPGRTRTEAGASRTPAEFRDDYADHTGASSRKAS